MSDARLATDRRVVEDPEADRKRKLRLRWYAAILGVVATVGGLSAVFGQGGYVEMRRLRREIAVLRAEVEERRQSVRALEDERDRLLDDPLANERIARERLGMVRSGEIDFLLPRDADTTTRRRG